MASIPSNPPLLAPSKYLFHPIGDDEDELQLKDGQYDDTAQASCSSSLIEQENIDEYEMELTPYPAYTTTDEEIEDRMSLGGEDWCLFLQHAADAGLAGAITFEPCEMSLDGTTVSDDTGSVACDEGRPCSSLSFFGEDCFVEAAEPQEITREENEETRRKRNLLWKQSLKPSIFAQQRAA